jgi:hypothetical protein
MHISPIRLEQACDNISKCTAKAAEVLKSVISIQRWSYLASSKPQHCDDGASAYDGVETKEEAGRAS